MLGRCPRPFLHRSSSKHRLMQNHDLHRFPVAEDEKPLLQPPHQVVIGFDLRADCNKASQSEACESPRSVLEFQNICFPRQHQPSRSPRSALGSLLSGNGCNDPPRSSFSLKVPIKAQEVDEEEKLKLCMESKPIAIGGQNRVMKPAQNQQQYQGSGRRVCISRPCRIVCTSYYDDMDSDSNDVEEEDAVDTVFRESIFSTASPVCSHPSFDIPNTDFLSKCFLCKRRLAQGKDIYMYRGDRAFCSQECRYQQIITDERKERCPRVASCFYGGATHGKKVQTATQAAVA